MGVSELHGPHPTLWSGTGAFGPAWCWGQPRVRRLFDDARPPGGRIHADGFSLAKHGGKLADEMRSALGEFDPWFAIAGDAYSPNQQRSWVAAAHAAKAAGVRVLELNPEAASKSTKFGLTIADRVKHARELVQAVHEAEPSLILAHTAYREPHAHKTYPYGGYLGPGTPVAFHSPQMFGARADSSVRADRSCKILEAAGVLAPGLPVHGYFSTDAPLAVVCAAAVRYQTQGFWVLRPGDITADSYTAIRVLSELHRRGYRGPDAIKQFQRDHGLKSDGVVGPLTLAALGIPFGLGLES